MTDENQSAWWRDTRRLATSILTTALLLIILGTIAVMTLDAGEFAGFPPGYLLAAFVLPVALVGLAFWFCRRQGTIDRRHGLSEE